MVFRDYNGNGLMDTGSVTTSVVVDAGVAGVTIAGPGASNHGIDFGFVPASAPTLSKTALAYGAVQPGQRI